MDNTDEFVAAVRENLDGDASDLADALYRAMEAVPCYPTGREARYFGAVGDGTFYAGGSIEETRWYPDTTPAEALALLSLEFGDDYTEGLEPYPFLGEDDADPEA